MAVGVPQDETSEAHLVGRRGQCTQHRPTLKHFARTNLSYRRERHEVVGDVCRIEPSRVGGLSELQHVRPRTPEVETQAQQHAITLAVTRGHPPVQDPNPVRDLTNLTESDGLTTQFCSRLPNSNANTTTYPLYAQTGRASMTP